MKILLIQPDNKKIKYYGYQDIGSHLQPLGLAYLASALEKAGHEVSIIDMTIQNFSSGRIAKLVKSCNFELVGLNVTTIMFQTTENLARIIKNLNPNVLILIGGPHVSSCLYDSINNKVFDFAIFGEGEETIVELADFLENKGKRYIKKKSLKEFSKINGLAFRFNDEIIVNKPRKFIQNIDKLPFPARHLLPHPSNYHLNPDRSYDEPIGTISTSRGCPHRCIFCDKGVFGKKWRGRSAKNMLEEIKFLIKKYGVREIDFEEDLFNLSKKRIYRFCQLIEQEKINIKWQCLIKVNGIDEKLIKTMASSGCWLISIGIESGSQRIIDFLNKDLNISKVKYITRLADKHGIKIRGLFMIGNPTETHKDIKATLDLILSLPLHTIIVSIINPYPNTKLWNIANKYGRFKKELTLNEFPKKLNFVAYGFTSEELVKLLKTFYINFFFRPKQIFRYVKWISSLKPRLAMRTLKYYGIGAIKVLKK